MQYGIVSKVISRRENVKSFVLVPDPERGSGKFVPFRAGQYISITQWIGMRLSANPIRSAPIPRMRLTPKTLPIR